MEGSAVHSATPPPGAWAPPLPALATAAGGELGAAAPCPYPYPYPAPALNMTLPGWAWGWTAAPEDSIPAAWGPPTAASEAWRSATWPPAELGTADLAMGPLPPVAWQLQEPCCLDAQCVGYPPPQLGASWAGSPQHQDEASAMLASAQQLQVQQQALYYQHPQPGPPLAFAISPPAPGRERSQAQPGAAAAPRPGVAPRLARKKKAALPAEPSFGCNADGLGGGGSSAALVFSAEPSASEAEALEGVAEEGSAGAGGEAGWASRATGPPPADARPAPGPKLAAQPSIAYDRSPRPTAWAPFTFAEYQRRGYDPKAAPKYWQLPTSLGPDRGAHWQAQLSKHERQQRFGEQASQQNRQRIAASPPPQRPPPPRPGADVRERALHFARTAVPKPSSFRSRAAAEGGGQGGEAAATAAAAAAAVEDAGPAAVAETAAALPCEEAGEAGRLAEQAAAQLGAMQLETAAGAANGV